MLALVAFLACCLPAVLPPDQLRPLQELPLHELPDQDRPLQDRPSQVLPLQLTLVQDRFSNLDTSSPENTSIYNSDGVQAFATGAFAKAA